MATHDYVIANGTGAAVRSDLNNALAAIVSNNSGSSEPATTYAYQWWADTTANVLKIRNSANNAWITLRELDGTMLIEDGGATAPGLSFASDTNTGFFSGGADKIGFATGGAERLEIGSSEVVFNDPSNDVDFRVESNGVSHMLFVDGGTNRVGIGASAPGVTLDISAISAATRITSSTGTNPAYLQFVNTAGNAYVGLESSSGGGAAVGNAAYALHLSHQGAYPINFSTNNALRATVDSAGRFLVGTSSATHGASATAEIAGTNTDYIFSLTNDTASDTDGHRFSYLAFTGTQSGGEQSILASVNGAHDGSADDTKGMLVFRTNSGSEGGTIPTERMRIDSSGRLLVGTTSAASTSSGNILQSVHSSGSSLILGRNDTSVGDGEFIGGVRFFANDPSGYNEVAAILCESEGSHNSNDYPTRLEFFTTADNAGSKTERMRISNKGDMFTINGDNGIVSRSTLSAGTSNTVFLGQHSATSITSGTNSFKVFTNGNVQNTNNSYGALSDVKLKENIVDASSQWDDIKDIRVRNYNFIEGQTHTQIGVVAQEVETVSPGLVFDTPDRDDEGVDLGTVTKSVNYSVLYMKAVKALQEAMDRIETLEAKVAALEAG